MPTNNNDGAHYVVAYQSRTSAVMGKLTSEPMTYAEAKATADEFNANDPSLFHYPLRLALAASEPRPLDTDAESA